MKALPDPLSIRSFFMTEKNIGYVQAVPIKDGYEVGYHMAEAYRGKGYTTEALRAFLPVLMDQLKIEHIYGICHGENIPSQRVLRENRLHTGV